MGAYDFKITHFNGVSLPATPVESINFDPNLWPGHSGRQSSVDAKIPGRGNRFIRRQPLPAKAELIVMLDATDQTDLVTQVLYLLFLGSHKGIAAKAGTFLQLDLKKDRFSNGLADVYFDISEEALDRLDEDGLVHVGAKVFAGDIFGKVSFAKLLYA